MTECLDISTKGFLIKILETELISGFADEFLKNPPELDHELLFEEEEKKEEDSRADVANKH